MSALGDVVSLFRKMDRLLLLEDKHGKAIADLEANLDALTHRVTRLEAEQGIVVAEAKGAAAVAATSAMTSTMMDLARRVGALEARMSRPGPPALSSDPSP